MLRAVARTAARRTALPVARRQVNLAALEAKVTSDEGKSELSRLKMALGVCRRPRTGANGGERTNGRVRSGSRRRRRRGELVPINEVACAYQPIRPNL